MLDSLRLYIALSPSLHAMASAMAVMLAKWAVLGIPRHLIPWAWRHSCNRQKYSELVHETSDKGHPVLPYICNDYNSR